MHERYIQVTYNSRGMYVTYTSTEHEMDEKTR